MYNIKFSKLKRKRLKNNLYSNQRERDQSPMDNDNIIKIKKKQKYG